MLPRTVLAAALGLAMVATSRAGEPAPSAAVGGLPTFSSAGLTLSSARQAPPAVGQPAAPTFDHAAALRQGLQTDYLSPDMWLLGLFRPKPTPVKPEVVFKYHQSRHLLEDGWTAAEVKHLNDKIITPRVEKNLRRGDLPWKDTVVYPGKGKAVEFRAKEISPGRVNVGSSYEVPLPPLPPASPAGRGLGPAFGLGAGLVVPSSAPLHRPVNSSPVPVSSIWDKPSLLPKADAPKYNLGVDYSPLGKFANPTPRPSTPTTPKPKP